MAERSEQSPKGDFIGTVSPAPQRSVNPRALSGLQFVSPPTARPPESLTARRLSALQLVSPPCGCRPPEPPDLVSPPYGWLVSPPAARLAGDRKDPGESGLSHCLTPLRRSCLTPFRDIRSKSRVSLPIGHPHPDSLSATQRGGTATWSAIENAILHHIGNGRGIRFPGGAAREQRVKRFGCKSWGEGIYRVGAAHRGPCRGPPASSPRARRRVPASSPAAWHAATW